MNKRTITTQQFVKIDNRIIERTSTHIVTGAHGHETLCIDGFHRDYNSNKEMIENAVSLGENQYPITCPTCEAVWRDTVYFTHDDFSDRKAIWTNSVKNSIPENSEFPFSKTNPINDQAIVYLNNVKIGSMPLEDYKEIVRSERKNWRNYLLSIKDHANFLLNTAKLIVSCFTQPLMIALAIAVLIANFSPERVSALIELFLDGNIREISGVISTIANFYFVVSLVLLYFKFLSSNNFDSISPFKKAINIRVREFMKIRIEGDILVFADKKRKSRRQDLS